MEQIGILIDVIEDCRSRYQNSNTLEQVERTVTTLPGPQQPLPGRLGSPLMCLLAVGRGGYDGPAERTASPGNCLQTKLEPAPKAYALPSDVQGRTDHVFSSVS